ncbi:hypothetical protein B0O95_10457 [Mycetohabitans endofungorum]|uniref:Uncharacterized protein n=1 Tax=Mycetohabitans endofungorum TaxID=417203 RepID=A0A2P5KBM6_9BURK|nr:hypothetical protein B0O95_10457 [Mycetohabitans endofungorum]
MLADRQRPIRITSSVGCGAGKPWLTLGIPLLRLRLTAATARRRRPAATAGTSCMATLCQDSPGNPRVEREQVCLPASAPSRIQYIVRRAVALRAFGSTAPVDRARETEHVVCVWLPAAPTPLQPVPHARNHPGRSQVRDDPRHPQMISRMPGMARPVSRSPTRYRAGTSTRKPSKADCTSQLRVQQRGSWHASVRRRDDL